MKIGIIGDGRFGNLLFNTFNKHLDDVEIKMYARSRKSDNQKYFELFEVCDVDLLVPCVPISAFKDVMFRIKDLVKEDTTVMDICSVKVKPVEWMREILNDADIIASHPVFGPDSSKNGTDFGGLNLMVSNISASDKMYEFIKNFWINLGVNVLEMSPEKHDEYSAYTINYNHLIGRIGEIIGVEPTPIDTKGFKVIYEAMSYVTNDTWELFRDMQNYNPFAKKMRDEVRDALIQIEKKLEN